MADRVTAFTFQNPRKMKSPLVRLEKVDAGYSEGHAVLKKLDLYINHSDRTLCSARMATVSRLWSKLFRIASSRWPATSKSGQLKIAISRSSRPMKWMSIFTPSKPLRAAIE